MTDFTPIDADAVHRAMLEASAEADERPTEGSIEAALRDQAARLKVVRDKILDRLPEEWHEHRAIRYPDYKPVAEKQSVT